MKRFTMVWGLAAMLTWGASVPVWAQGGGQDILSAVPEKAWATLFIRNARELDQKLMGLSQQLSLPPMSLLQMAKMSMGLMGGVNDDGSVAIVLMPNPAIMADPTATMAVLVPCSDYPTLTQTLQPQEAGEGISKVMLAGQESYMARYGPFAVMGPSQQAVQAILAEKEGAGLGAAWTAHQKGRYGEDDIILHLNLKGVITDPSISPMLMQMAAMGGGPAAAQGIQQYETLSIGVRLEKDGIRLGFYIGATAGGELANMLASGPTSTDSMLIGQPDGRYVLAAGGRVPESAGPMMAGMIMGAQAQAMATAGMPGAGFDPAKFQEMVQLWTDLLSGAQTVSFAWSALPSGGDGIISLTKCVTFSGDAAVKLEKIGALVQNLAAMAQSGAGQNADPVVEYQVGAETVEGVSVNRLKVHLDRIPDMPAENRENVTAILGGDGLDVRLAAVDNQRVVVSLGGGQARMEALINAAKSGAAPLSSNAGLQQAAAMLSPQRSAEGYLALDTLLNTIVEIGKVLPEPQELPFPVTSVPTPVAMIVMPGGDRGMQVDVALPMPVILAAKNAVMNYGAGGPAPAGGQSPPPGSTN